MMLPQRASFHQRTPQKMTLHQQRSFRSTDQRAISQHTFQQLTIPRLPILRSLRSYKSYKSNSPCLHTRETISRWTNQLIENPIGPRWRIIKSTFNLLRLLLSLFSHLYLRQSSNRHTSPQTASSTSIRQFHHPASLPSAPSPPPAPFSSVSTIRWARWNKLQTRWKRWRWGHTTRWKVENSLDQSLGPHKAVMFRVFDDQIWSDMKHSEKDQIWSFFTLSKSAECLFHMYVN